MTDLRRKIWTLIRGGSFRGYLRTVSGTLPITLTDCMADKPVSLAVSGNAVQDGTPTPDNPVEVRGCGDRTGNLFDADSAPVITGVVNKTTLIFTEVYGTAYTYFNCLPNTTYTISKLPQGGIYCLADTPPAIGKKCRTRFASDSDAGITTSRATITTGDSDTYIWISLIASTGGEYSAEEMVSSIQIENEGTTVLPYEPYGYKVPLQFRGKNLFKTEQAYKDKTSSTISSSISGIQAGTYTMVVEYSSYPTAAAYGVSVSITSLDGVILNVNKTVAGGIRCYTTFVLTEEQASQATNILVYPFAQLNGYTIKNVMLLKGSYTADTLPPYESYHAPVTFPIYLDAPLYGNGSVSDTVELDVEHRTAVLSSRFVKKNFSGSEYWVYDSDNGFFWAGLPNKVAGSMYCNYFKNKGVGNAHNFGNCGDADVRILIGNKTSSGVRFESVSDFKAYLADLYASGKPLTVVYTVSSETTTDISHLQNWDAIPKLWRGTVIVSADTTVEPSNIITKYYADKPEEVNNIAVR